MRPPRQRHCPRRAASVVVNLGLLVLLCNVAAAAVTAAASFGAPMAFVSPSRSRHLQQVGFLNDDRAWLLRVRGGASTQSALDDDDDEEDLEEEDDEEETVVTADMDDDEEEEEEEEAAFDAKLAASTARAAAKTKNKLASRQKASVKEAVNTKLLAKKPSAKQGGGGILKALHVPYILRASLNPVTLLAMTKSYWISLFDLDYPPKDVAQELRSSLEDKARKQGGGTSGGRKRKMKRGQAKTLSDLPKLNT